MTGPMHMLLAATRFGVNPLFNAFMSNVNPATGLRSVTLTFNSDGSTSITNSPPATANAWGLPAQSGAGAGIWVKISVTASSATTYGGTIPVSTWVQLNTNQTFQVTNNATTTEGTGTADVQFATDGSGTNIIATLTGVLTWDVGYVP